MIASRYVLSWYQSAEIILTLVLQRPILKVNLVESLFVFGVIDAIEIEPAMVMREPSPLNPAIILAFVEGVLGYKETHTTGRQWVFKLVNPLK